ncbi:MAG: hypothetical protein K5868_06555 [Lachnospiraceae bacterium]|nr:hypothetical protein [Lachnospiraceae bacterium]
MIGNKTVRYYVACKVLLPLLIGGIMYYLFFPEVTFVKTLDSYMPFHYHICGIYNNYALVPFLRFYLFDFIWAYSFANMLQIILLENRVRILLTYVIALSVGVQYEFSQLTGLFFGTFDIFDIIAEAIGITISMLTTICSRRDKNEKN